MSTIKSLLYSIWFDNFTFDNNMQLLVFCMIYLLMFLVIFLENAIIFGVFLPGDSLLIILGILIAKGILNFFITLGILTIATSLGSWISYLQGRFMYKNKTIQIWFSYLPNRFYQQASYMFNKHGLCALFIGRFIAFVRTALPIIAGVSGLSSVRFQLFNWISSFLWVLVLIVLGFFVERLALWSYFVKIKFIIERFQ